MDQCRHAQCVSSTPHAPDEARVHGDRPMAQMIEHDRKATRITVDKLRPVREEDARRERGGVVKHARQRRTRIFGQRATGYKHGLATNIEAHDCLASRSVVVLHFLFFSFFMVYGLGFGLGPFVLAQNKYGTPLAAFFSSLRSLAFPIKKKEEEATTQPITRRKKKIFGVVDFFYRPGSPWALRPSVFGHQKGLWLFFALSPLVRWRKPMGWGRIHFVCVFLFCFGFFFPSRPHRRKQRLRHRQRATTQQCALCVQKRKKRTPQRRDTARKEKEHTTITAIIIIIFLI